MSIRRMRVLEVVLQLLYQHEKNPTLPRTAIVQFAQERLSNSDLQQQALQLYDAVLAQQDSIDAHISRATQNWRLYRMLATDRNVMRIATCQLLAQVGQPPKSKSVGRLIEEAISLARRFGSAESSAFVNGILDRVAKDIHLPIAQPPASLAATSANAPALPRSRRPRKSTFFPRPSTLKPFRKKRSE